ncbi:glycosyltransferase family 2 protein [Fimicolochytrium jonesii]|uniref:glycosyltransferase family 2 protein n=1 Tax=Fimicolochytrium jonesii TaxID=1396493 RepID=UPI0022FDC488|nr:glycosyltransferase family 2 protein [Fimicolochytrium jonesii]KAI8819501.1 glycosyltransferase family 2 protein [Fimicolochytrium jonesii]
MLGTLDRKPLPDTDGDALLMETGSQAASEASSVPEGRAPHPASYAISPFETPTSHYSFDRRPDNVRVGNRPAASGRPPVEDHSHIFPARHKFEIENGNLVRRQTGGGGLGRKNTLSKPERSRSTRRALMRRPSAAPPAARAGATSVARPEPSPLGKQKKEEDPNEDSQIWPWSARILTCCCLPFCLTALGKRDRAVQQAWREKVALCMIILVLCLAVVFLTVGLRRVLCPDTNDGLLSPMFSATPSHDYLPADVKDVVVGGYSYDFEEVKKNLGANGFILTDDFKGKDITKLFGVAQNDANCQAVIPATGTCAAPEVASITRPAPGQCARIGWVTGISNRARRYMEWTDLNHTKQTPNVFTVFNGVIVNITEFLSGGVSRTGPYAFLADSIGRDGTYHFMRKDENRKAMNCLRAAYHVGYIGVERNGCIAAQVIETITLVVISGVVLSKFFMAVWFHWFGLPKLKPTNSMLSNDNKSKRLSRASARYSIAMNNRHSVIGSYTPYQSQDLYTIMLVTCYSEGHDGIRGTLDSLAGTEYPDSRKLLFVIADGMITGSGEEKSTPDIILGMMQFDPGMTEPEPRSYIAIADGEKQHNMAKVYAGYYIVGSRRVPMVTVVKCGTPAEASAAKPGNRGKRDSQMVIMNFLSRTLFNDRMTALDYEIFTAMNSVATTADKYEVILMVDADTKVAPDSLKHMVNVMKTDVNVMGLCGETRIANKTASLTSAIQVFEYYISHHLGKAFESVFGGVTCLPGCFCMYRIKAPKGENGITVPILTNPDIVEEYSENIVETLHKKNLLLLGEDRFLTTLMLRNFPHRKMIFVPQAVCWTMVPDQFKVLLSQRRRWINSTVHNLLELVLVRDLCGTFCFSMQFVVLLELIGTVVLPAAICLTLYLILSAAINHNAELVPFLMLAAILGLPGFLIVITTRKMIYVLWMMVYLVSLPIWNFVLPVYAYWHFDDFSWGETRKVEGETREEAHGGKIGQFESRAVAMKKWVEWEKEKQSAGQSAPEKEREKSRRFSAWGGRPPSAYGGVYGVKPQGSQSQLQLNNVRGRSTDVVAGANSGSSTSSLTLTNNPRSQTAPIPNNNSGMMTDSNNMQFSPPPRNRSSIIYPPGNPTHAHFSEHPPMPNFPSSGRNPNLLPPPPLMMGGLNSPNAGAIHTSPVSYHHHSPTSPVGGQYPPGPAPAAGPYAAVPDQDGGYASALYGQPAQQQPIHPPVPRPRPRSTYELIARGQENVWSPTNNSTTGFDGASSSGASQGRGGKRK